MQQHTHTHARTHTQRHTQRWYSMHAVVMKALSLEMSLPMNILNIFTSTCIFQERHYVFLDFARVAIFILRAFQLVREELFGSFCPHPLHVELHSVLIELGLNAIHPYCCFRRIQREQATPLLCITIDYCWMHKCRLYCT